MAILPAFRGFMIGFSYTLILTILSNIRQGVDLLNENKKVPEPNYLFVLSSPLVSSLVNNEKRTGQRSETKLGSSLKEITFGGNSIWTSSSRNFKKRHQLSLESLKRRRA